MIYLPISDNDDDDNDEWLVSMGPFFRWNVREESEKNDEGFFSAKKWVVLYVLALQSRVTMHIM